MNRDCGLCVCATKVWNGGADELICANYPGHDGDLSHVTAGTAPGDCRKFWQDRRPAASEAVPVEDGSVRYISLGDGKSVMVDAADFEWLNKYRWRTTGGTKGYVHTRIKRKTVYMHRLIMNPPEGKVVDHKNGNVWDNRRCNLRDCTQAQNSMNSRARTGTSSIFKGVNWNKKARKWGAAIVFRGKAMRLGFYTDEAEAARAYDRKARELFGVYAYLNFPDQVRYVDLSGTIHLRSRGWGRIHVHKSETRISKSETNPKDRNSKFKTNPNRQDSKSKTEHGPAPAFRSFSYLSIRACLGFRHSSFGFARGRWAQKKNRAGAPHRADGSVGCQNSSVGRVGLSAGPSAELFACVGVPAPRASRSKRSVSCHESGLPFRRAS